MRGLVGHVPGQRADEKGTANAVQADYWTRRLRGIQPPAFIPTTRYLMATWAQAFWEVSWGLIPGLGATSLDRTAQYCDLFHALLIHVLLVVVPDEAQPSFFLGYGIILLCNFTTTYKHPLLPYLRLGLAFPSAYALYDYGFSGKYGPTMKRNVDLGMALVAIYGTLKLVEVCVIGFRNGPEDWPKWVTLEDPGSKKTDGERPARKSIPFTPTFWGRLCYAHDLMNVRGSSWYRGRVWDWAPAAILDQDPKPMPQLRFIQSSILKVLECYIIQDIIETIVSSRVWDTMDTRPVTSLPFPQQLLFAFCVCTQTVISISIPYATAAAISGLFGAPSTAYPPMFDSPFAATSLAEFWALKWHAIVSFHYFVSSSFTDVKSSQFRRVFNQWSTGIMALLPTKYFNVSSRSLKFIRALIIFSLSYTVHLFLVWAVPDDGTHPRQTFFNLQAARFFLSQPLGILIEALIIMPLTRGLPTSSKIALRRIFAWGWLLWSGRYWADVWFAASQMGYAERYIKYSPVRGLLRGQWVI